MQSAGYFRRILIKFEFSRHVFEKVSNIKFHKNPSNGNRVVPCGQTDMTKLRAAFRNFANAPKKCMQEQINKYQSKQPPPPFDRTARRIVVNKMWI
jgi:hypothetical protein